LNEKSESRRFSYFHFGEREKMKRGVVLFCGLLVAIMLFFSFVLAQEEGYEGEEDESIWEKYLSPIFSPFNASVTIGGFNTAPVLRYLESEIMLCEDEGLFTYLVNGSDVDVGDVLTFHLDPLGPFFIRPFGQQSIVDGEEFAHGEIWGVFGESDDGFYANRIVRIDDGTTSSVNNYTNITVIEVNGAPFIENITEQSIDLGASSELIIQFVSYDNESNSTWGGNFSYNITNVTGDLFLNISASGLFNQSFNSTHVGNYEYMVCVIDSAIPPGKLHQNISLCGPDAAQNKSSCTSFNLTITPEVIQVSSTSSSGGGGGGGSPPCEVQWACYDWAVCAGADTSLRGGKLIGDEFREIKDECSGVGWAGNKCGFQTRYCFDSNECNRELDVPDDMQACYFTVNPTCSDGIKNCHSNGCEFLVDCGGPCESCASCSDGIQNQNEKGIDCGGSCPRSCSTELVSGISVNFKTIFGVILAIILHTLFNFLIINLSGNGIFAVFINGLPHFFSYQVKGFLDGDLDHGTVFTDLGLGDSVLAIQSLNGVVSLDAAEALIDRTVRIPLHSNCPIAGDTYKQTAAGAAETTGRLVPGNPSGRESHLFPGAEADAGKQCRCRRPD